MTIVKLAIYAIGAVFCWCLYQIFATEELKTRFTNLMDQTTTEWVATFFLVFTFECIYMMYLISMCWFWGKVGF